MQSFELSIIFILFFYPDWYLKKINFKRLDSLNMDSTVIRETIYKYLFLILTVIGIVLYLLARTDYPFVEGYEDLLRDFGVAILSSGVFASVLKSIQFTGIFKKELESIILDSSYLKKRSDLEEIWRKVSRAMYEAKFHRFSDDLEKMILDDYLPIKDNLYYEDLDVTIDILNLEGDELTYKVTTNVCIYPINPTERIEIVHRYEIKKTEDRGENTQEVLSYTVNGDDIEFKYDKDDEEPDISGKFYRVQKYDLQGKSKYETKRVLKRTVSLKNDDNIMFRVGHITKNMNVLLYHPEDLNATFIEIGVVNNFKRKHVGEKNVKNYIHDNGVILPLQGFGFSFIKK